MPGRICSRRLASAAASVALSSSRPATWAAVAIVRARTASAPARCHSHDGIRAQVRAGGKTRMPRGAGPGAAEPYRYIRIRHARCASMLTTFCSRTAGTRASMTRWLRPMRRPSCRVASWRSSGCRGRKPSRSSRAPSRSGTVSSSHAAPGPQASDTMTPARAGSTRSVAGPSGVSEVRQTAPAPSTR